MAEFGAEVKRLRTERRLTQAELAFYSKTSQPTINQIETGKRNPSAETLIKIANALGVEVVDLFPKAQSQLSLEELAAGTPLLEKVLDAARQDAKKKAQASNRAVSSEGRTQVRFASAEDRVRTELRSLGPDALFEGLVWPLAELVVQLKQQNEIKDRELARRESTTHA